MDRSVRSAKSDHSRRIGDFRPLEAAPTPGTSLDAPARAAAVRVNSLDLPPVVTTEDAQHLFEAAGPKSSAREEMKANEGYIGSTESKGRFFIELDELEYISPTESSSTRNSGSARIPGAQQIEHAVPVFVESAHWVRGVQEDVVYDENGKGHFSTPRAGSSTLHGFYALQRELSRGVVLLDLEGGDVAYISQVRKNRTTKSRNYKNKPR